MRTLAAILIHYVVPFFFASILLSITLAYELVSPGPWGDDAKLAGVIIVVYVALGAILISRLDRARRLLFPQADREPEPEAPEPVNAEWLSSDLADPVQRRAYLAQENVDCPACQYNLRGTDGIVCPECGRPVADSDLNSSFALDQTFEHLARPAMLDLKTWNRPRREAPAWTRVIALLLMLAMLLAVVGGGLTL